MGDPAQPPPLTPEEAAQSMQQLDAVIRVLASMERDDRAYDLGARLEGRLEALKEAYPAGAQLWAERLDPEEEPGLDAEKTVKRLLGDGASTPEGAPDSAGAKDDSEGGLDSLAYDPNAAPEASAKGTRDTGTPVWDDRLPPGAGETASLKFSRALLGPLSSKLGAAFAQAIPVDEPGVPEREYTRGPQPAPLRSASSAYDAGGVQPMPVPGGSTQGLEKYLDERATQGQQAHPTAAAVGQMGGTTLRNLPVSLIPGGLLAQVAASVPVTAANLAFDASTEGADVGEALKDPGAYATSAAGATLGPLLGGIAKRLGPREVESAARGVRGGANVARLRASGAGKAQLDRAAKGKGAENIMGLAEDIEAEGLQGKLPSSPRKVYERAEALKPEKGAKLDVLAEEAQTAIPPMDMRQIKGWFEQKRDEMLALAENTGDPELLNTAEAWDEHARTLRTYVLEGSETPRIPSRSRVKHDVLNPNAHLPIPASAASRSPTSGQRPYVHEVEDLAHPGVMKPDPQGKRTLKIPILGETLKAGWKDLWQKRQHYDKLAKAAYEGGDQKAAAHAREIAGYFRNMMHELADRAPAEFGDRLRKANREYEAVSYAEKFAANKLFDVAAPEQVGRDVSRAVQGGLAAKDPVLALASGAAGAAGTLSRNVLPDINARRLRWAQRRVEGYMKPGGGAYTAVPRAAAVSIAPSAAALREAIMQERARAEQEP